MTSPIVSTRGLAKRYGRVTALADCSLEVAAGEILGLLGPNGSGKTTLLRVLLGLIRPTSGVAQIAGLDCWRDSLAIRRRVAYLPGEARVFRGMRGSEALQFFERIRPGTPPGRNRQLAERLGLDLARRVSAMSTGMRQKLALAAVLAAPVELLILDEPTENLDPTVRQEVLRLVAECRQAGQTVLFSSHVMDETESVCDRVVILRGGQLVCTQALSQLRRRHSLHARLTGEMPPVPARLAAEVSLQAGPAGELRLETTGELAPLLGWLATLPLAEVRIEPVGLASIYRRYHPGVPA